MHTVTLYTTDSFAQSWIQGLDFMVGQHAMPVTVCYVKMDAVESAKWISVAPLHAGSPPPL